MGLEGSSSWRPGLADRQGDREELHFRQLQPRSLAQRQCVSQRHLRSHQLNLGPVARVRATGLSRENPSKDLSNMEQPRTTMPTRCAKPKVALLVRASMTSPMTTRTLNLARSSRNARHDPPRPARAGPVWRDLVNNGVRLRRQVGREFRARIHDRPATPELAGVHARRARSCLYKGGSRLSLCGRNSTLLVCASSSQAAVSMLRSGQLAVAD